MESKEVNFLADSMLGRLAKWLRVMGYDTHYQPMYKMGEIEKLILSDRLFITRNQSKYLKYKPSLLILSNNIQDQLHEIKNKGYLLLDYKKIFSRCLICNVNLVSVTMENAGNHVPEYILTRNTIGISYCPVCNRYFWPGSHRKRMLNQIAEWGFHDLIEKI